MYCEKKYNEALERARKIHNETKFDYEKGMIEEIFPELEESEDGKMKETCKFFLNLQKINSPNSVSDIDKCIAWLEKQGQTFTPKDVDDAYLKCVCDAKHELEKQGEQKPTMKVKEAWKEMRLEVYAQASGNRHQPNCSDNSTKMFSLNDIDEIIECINERTTQGKSALETVKEEKVNNKNCVKSDDKSKPFDKYEVLTDFERTLADICIGWIGEEIGWKEYIKDNANVLLEIAIKKFNSVQDSEQKPDDNTEPLFHVDDWVVDNDCGKVNQVSEIQKNGYGFKNGDYSSFESAAKDYHPWTIKDAKDGDVLATGQVVLIFKTIHGVWLNCYCSAHKDGSFIADSYDLLTDKYFGEVYPATKEQREYLSQKMCEAGYGWFEDTKELVNIKAEKENLDKLRVARLDELPKVGSDNQSNGLSNQSNVSNVSNGVWHTADEAPVGSSDRQILVLFKDDDAMVALVEDWENLDNQEKWAYIKDLTK